MYITRAIERKVLALSEMFPVLMLTGPRQTGKTTMLMRLAQGDRNYVTLDDPDVRSLAKSDPALFLQRYQPPVIIDEIQYAPQLLPYIKMAVDSTQKKGAFWLTGSQMFHAMKDVSESLAGRVGLVNLLGLSLSEIRGLPSEPFTTSSTRLIQRMRQVPPMGLPEIFDGMVKGGMPAVHAHQHVDLETYYASYVSTYLQRDIRDLTQVADEMAFYNFMICVAARTGKPVVYDELAKEVGISAPTAKKWLSVLVSSHIVALVQPFHNNALKRIVKTPLLHFLDMGLCAHLLKWRSGEVLERGAMSGAFFESWVFSEIYKSYINDAKVPPVYYYRDKDKKEIDLLLHADGMLFPIEVKKSASPGTEAIKHFDVLKPITEPERFGALDQHKMGIGEGAVICMARDVIPLDRKNSYVPAWLI